MSESGRVFDRDTTGTALVRAFHAGPVEALLVPEELLVALVLTAREVVFRPDMFDDGSGPKHLLPRDLIDSLDQTSEPFADMLDLPFSESTIRRGELCVSAGHVRDWLDAGCITIPPAHHIRALVESILGIRSGE